MDERAARALAEVLAGEAHSTSTSLQSWAVLVERSHGRLSAVEDRSGRLYRDRAAYENHRRAGDQDGVLAAREWREWDGGEEWARGLSVVLGSEEYWHSGGGIWLVLFDRLDGRFAVVGSESGGVYASREEYEAEESGEASENHHFV